MSNVIELKQYVNKKWPECFRNQVAELASRYEINLSGFRSPNTYGGDKPVIAANDYKAIEAVDTALDLLPAMLTRKKKTCERLRRNMQKITGNFMPSGAVILAALIEDFKVSQVGFSSKARIGC